MQNRTSKAFTLVELMIVIVVVAILAAITIVAYSGITKRANQTSITSAVSDWVKLIQTEGADPSFSLGISSFVASCIGQGTSDYPAGNGFPAGECMYGSDGETFSYNATVFAAWPTSQPRPSGVLPVAQVTLPGGVIFHARGAWLNQPTSGAARTVTINWIVPINGQCWNGASNLNGTQDGDYCSYTFSY